MTTLKFVDTHNMVAFLAKPAESEGFEQIVDFLNAHTIKYALTINPTIYTSCIEQFWATVKAKTVNGEVQLQALVDGKKIIITESIVRRDLQLEDAEGVDCLPNATIFEQLTLMGSKTTAWNEFSSTMASAIICLATNQKFNFSKYIFESMVKNLDNAGKFLMYPRFVQVFVNQQLEGMPTHKRIYIAPSHTKKIFRNMRRVGKGFSGRETPLFQTMVVHNQEEMGEDNVADEAVNEEVDDILVRAATTTTSLDAEQDRGNINKTRYKATLNEPSSSGTSSCSGPRCQETMGDTIAQTRFENVSKHSNDPLLVRDGGLGEEDASKHGRIADIDANEDIYLVNVQTNEDMFGVNDLDGDEVIVESVDVVNTAEETRSVVEEVTAITIPVSAATTTTTAITNVEITLAQALAQLKSAKPKADKGQAPTPTVSSQQPSHVKVHDKGKGKMVKPEPVKKMSKKELLRLMKNLTFNLQARRRRRKNKEEILQLREQKKRGTDHQQELNKGDDGNDVTINGTPLSTKSPTIIDYKIYKEGKKSYFQIIRADGKTQMYLTFGKMLKNFDREDLEVLWSIVKARFKKTEPVNYMDNFLLLNLKTMFEHHVEDNNMLFYLLVEKIYPLTNHTLHQMFNDVKLQVDYECEMAFELLRLVKKQLKEGYGRIVGIKSLLKVTAAKVCVTAAKLKRYTLPLQGERFRTLFPLEACTEADTKLDIRATAIRKKLSSPHHAHLELVMHDIGKFITHVLTSQAEYNVIDINLNGDEI
ncbi:hypothetical protein Tco_1182511 [Tanacetum coccineum]